MAYEGEILTSCPSDIDFSVIQAVVVSGAGPNICGHMLLAIGSNSANVWYLHVAFQGVGEVGAIGAIQDGRIWDAVKDYALGNSGILTGYPKFMRGDAAYNRYLEENGKHEIRRLDA